MRLTGSAEFEITRSERIQQFYLHSVAGLDHRDCDAARATFADGCPVTRTFAAGDVERYFPRIQVRIDRNARTGHFVTNVCTEDLDGRRDTTQVSYPAYHLDLFDGGRPPVIAVRYSHLCAPPADGSLATERRVDEFPPSDSV